MFSYNGHCIFLRVVFSERPSWPGEPVPSAKSIGSPPGDQCELVGI